MGEVRKAGLRGAMERYLNEIWYRGRRPPLVLRGLAAVYGRIGLPRPTANRAKASWLPPVVVVGNLTAGGSGKSPLVAWIVERARELGLRPGIITRGYGGRGTRQPLRVLPGTSPRQAGDEPVMLARQTRVPVVACRRRLDAARALLGEVDLIVADDGLQHAALPRDFEIVVRDARRGFGNGLLLPAGPLREPVQRLDSADLVVDNGSAEGMTLAPRCWVELATGKRHKHLPVRSDRPVHAVAGIGDPERFFGMVEQLLDRTVERHPFPDHWAFDAEDLAGLRGRHVVMTAKDAVKCKAFAGEDWWWLEVGAELAPACAQPLLAWLASLKPVAEESR